MAKSGQIRLLIVDDHEVVRIGLSAVLNLTPTIRVVGQASQKEEATKLAVRMKPDVVLLDIRLPDGNGVDAARDILAACPTTRVLFLTSFADEHTVLEATLSGAQGYILKDIGSEALIRAVKAVAAGRSIIDPRLAKHAQRWLEHDLAQARHSKRPLLSPQEQRLLPMVAKGLTNREIARDLQLSEKTVKNYLANLFTKLHVAKRSQIAAFYAGSFKGTGAPSDPH